MKKAVTRNPVMTSAIVAGLIMAVSLGWINLNGDQIESIENFSTVIEPLLVMAVPVVLGWFARSKVTPMDDPRTYDGEEALIVRKQ